MTVVLGADVYVALFSDGDVRGCDSGGRGGGKSGRRRPGSTVYVESVALARPRPGLRRVSAHGAAARQRRPVPGGRYRQHRADGVGDQKHQGACRVPCRDR